MPVQRAAMSGGGEGRKRKLTKDLSCDRQEDADGDRCAKRPKDSSRRQPSAPSLSAVPPPPASRPPIPPIPPPPIPPMSPATTVTTAATLSLAASSSAVATTTTAAATSSSAAAIACVSASTPKPATNVPVPARSVLERRDQGESLVIHGDRLTNSEDMRQVLDDLDTSPCRPNSIVIRSSHPPHQPSEPEFRTFLDLEKLLQSALFYNTRLQSIEIDHMAMYQFCPLGSFYSDEGDKALPVLCWIKWLYDIGRNQLRSFRINAAPSDYWAQTDRLFTALGECIKLERIVFYGDVCPGRHGISSRIAQLRELQECRLHDVRLERQDEWALWNTFRTLKRLRVIHLVIPQPPGATAFDEFVLEQADGTGCDLIMCNLRISAVFAEIMINNPDLFSLIYRGPWDRDPSWFRAWSQALSYLRSYHPSALQRIENFGILGDEPLDLRSWSRAFVSFKNLRCWEIGGNYNSGDVAVCLNRLPRLVSFRWVGSHVLCDGSGDDDFIDALGLHRSLEVVGLCVRLRYLPRVLANMLGKTLTIRQLEVDTSTWACPDRERAWSKTFAEIVKCASLSLIIYNLTRWELPYAYFNAWNLTKCGNAAVSERMDALEEPPASEEPDEPEVNDDDTDCDARDKRMLAPVSPNLLAIGHGSIHSPKPIDYYVSYTNLRRRRQWMRVALQICGLRANASSGIRNSIFIGSPMISLILRMAGTLAHEQPWLASYTPDDES